MSSARGFLVGLLAGAAAVGGIWAWQHHSKTLRGAPSLFKRAMANQRIRGAALGVALGLARRKLGHQ